MNATTPTPLALPPPRYTLEEYVEHLLRGREGGTLAIDVLLAADDAVQAAADYWLKKDGAAWRNESPRDLPPSGKRRRSHWDRIDDARRLVVVVVMWELREERDRRRRTKRADAQRRKHRRQMRVNFATRRAVA